MNRIQSTLTAALGCFAFLMGWLMAYASQPEESIGRFNVSFNQMHDGKATTLWRDTMALDEAMTITKNANGNAEISFRNPEGETHREVCQSTNDYFSIWLPKLRTGGR